MPTKLPFSDQTLWLEERAIRPEGRRWARAQEATYVVSSLLMVIVATVCCSRAMFSLQSRIGQERYRSPPRGLR